MKRGLSHAAALLTLACLLPTTLAGQGNGSARVTESARAIPIAYRADVVVVGGSTGAVAAATAAAKEGANVFLAAPYPYLGEDMTATLRLWLEEGEVPQSTLAKKLFSERRSANDMVDPALLVPYTYETSLPSAGVHKDTNPPSRLNDGRWGAATDQSVQYDGDVSIKLKLEKPTELEAVHVLIYHAADFRVEMVSGGASLAGSGWNGLGVTKPPVEPQGSVTEPALRLTLPVTGVRGQINVSVERAQGSTRVLLGEVLVVRKSQKPPAPKKVEIPPARPLHIKKTLDSELIEAGIEFLYASYATDLLVDADGRPAGIVMANRAGRQAVLAKVIIDATEQATVARLAGADFRPPPSGNREVKFVVVGRRARTDSAVEHRILPTPFRRSGQKYSVIEYTLDVPLPDGSHASRAAAEQLARDATFRPDQQFTSDVLFEIPPDPIRAPKHVGGSWPGAAALDLLVFQSWNVPHIFVLGGHADMSRALAAQLMRPLNLIDVGSRVGAAAAKAALTRPAPRGVTVQTTNEKPTVAGEVREMLAGARPVHDLPKVPQGERALPVVGKYDVVVIGGGTSGAPTGIGAARRGARTLVVEYLHGLGGVGTLGAISSYYWGNRIGFSATVGKGGGRWQIEQKAEWWRKSLRDAKADIWFGTMGCGVVLRGNQVIGAVVATPEGRGVVLADVVVDCTGNSDIAAAAGARTLYTDATDIAMQGTGLPPRRLGTSYTNTDFTIVDETDMVDVWRMFVSAKHRAKDAFDIGRLIDTRERRRIVGGFTLTILDQMLERRYPDTIVVCYSDFDTHGYTTDPFFTLEHPPAKKGIYVHVPYRALLPPALEGIVVAGLGVSAHRDAIPLIRMQADMQNQGYAVGVAAAMASAEGKNPRDIDIRALQRHLIEIGNLPESVLTDKDTFPFPPERVAEAVKAAGNDYDGVAVILAHPEAALPLLRQAYKAAKTPEQRLIYAHILAVLGDGTGVERLIEAVRAFPGLDKGWRYTGMGQFGPNMSPLDRLIYALGRTGDKRAIEPILEKMKLLEAQHEFSHFRAVALALEAIGDPRATAALAELLSKPGIRGHASKTIQDAIEHAKKWPSWTATEPRSNAIREMILGRALYRCGDHEDIGREILEEYRDDVRGHMSRHAHAVLEERKSLD